MSNKTDNEWILHYANQLRDEINEVLSRYDVHSDVYEQYTLIDVLCVTMVDKIYHHNRKENK